MRIAYYLFSLAFIACSFQVGKDPYDPMSESVVIQVNLSETHQTIAHFGASDAWSCQFVGNWPDGKRDRIADLLFSRSFEADGSPTGIGLSLWRFNLGAGSASQGVASGIRDPWRRAPSVMDERGDFDPDRQQGQLWFARAAKDRGVENLLVFLNSPPVWLTRNGKAYTDSGNESNLPPSKHAEFGTYMAKAIAGMEGMGLSVQYISPVNEPQWDWEDGGQEGTPFWNEEIASITHALNSALETENLTAQIDLAEAGQIQYLYETYNRPGRSDQINAFFQPESEFYLGNLPRVSKSISGHSYFTTSPAEDSRAKRLQLRSAISAASGLSFWMSEYCILGDNAGEIRGNKRDLGMDAALYMARVIHQDLTLANASAWHWWLAVSPYDYKDGLIYVDKNEHDGEIYESKMLWVLGNYSRFIKPGFQRFDVETQHKHGDQTLMVSGFRSTEAKEMVFVIVNPAETTIPVDFSSIDLENFQLTCYLTDKQSNLKPFAADKNNSELAVPNRSVMTIVALEK
ncbi:putative xylanase [Lunatimonas lonarensis]|uniref:Putative xylanase n=1 Tax=Lunatimonas lonarensis TaxID=1232681 RepID=R7ZVY5_9BACT|nr:glycoside hydrolase [Lunatimonas lonarensis]EON78247.1 putative xylanase [Lunatimonas lonarensis]